ncbi:hypothetical protein DEJ48_36730 [Streptomyces venezuelae]|uniref:Uncharacterized protein n=1 Tax=Streptomyces venezuelae TaxID=54571 RepID=A0A5P2C6B0_STRVZ|nr:hypothetical protein [Streptomyces venezuelae]QES38234.1 hypothetical protein DEJ48_36730 [Streptomyces venezuelae]
MTRLCDLSVSSYLHDDEPPSLPGNRAAQLAGLRNDCMAELLEEHKRSGRTITVAPYVLASTGDERRAGLAQLGRFAEEQQGWPVTGSSFCDFDPEVPLEERRAFGAACRYASLGFASGILAANRAALTFDDAAYERVLTYLHKHRVFLAFLPLLNEQGAMS